MKLTPKRIMVSLFGAIVSCIGLYFIVLAGSENVPLGYFSSYKLYPHSRGDVIEFRDGLATLRTCCGDDEFGTYEQNDAGVWIWTSPLLERLSAQPEGTYPVRFILRPERFSLTIERENDPFSARTIRRRVFRKLPL